MLASEISEYSEEASGEGAVSEVDTSYSADVSQASDVDELCTDKTLQDDEQECENEDPRDRKYLHIYMYCIVHKNTRSCTTQTMHADIRHFVPSSGSSKFLTDNFPTSPRSKRRISACIK